jgi:hypothetical protein
MKNLKEIRNELLGLHKTLMEIERGNHEANHGKITNVQLFNLLFEHENFIWLREISVLVSAIDELSASKQGIDQEAANSLFAKAKVLFDETDEFQEFKKKYQANLDTETEVAFHHVKISKLLAKEKA